MLQGTKLVNSSYICDAFETFYADPGRPITINYVSGNHVNWLIEDPTGEKEM